MTTALNPQDFAVPCPTCDTPIDGYEHENGLKLTDPHAGPFGGPGTLLGTWDEVKHGERIGVTIEQAPEFGTVTLDPCGHTFRGWEGGTELLARIYEARGHYMAARADATIAAQADLLAAAEANGAGAVAERWRQAVRSRSNEQSGLLAALKTLVEATA